MFQLRIYTLRSADALENYAMVHWVRHLPTLRSFGVITHGVWTERGDDAHRLVALVEYPAGSDPDEMSRQIMASPEFASDMAGFDIADMVDVQTTLLDPTSYSPLR
ncbi:NIPSNAP domain-containing protein [Mycolicibacterium sp. CBM1]